MARGTRATGDYDEAHSAPLAANAEDAEEIQAVPVTKRVVSLRFPDLPHDALSNEHGNNAASIEGRLLDNDPRLPFWGWVFRRGKPGSRGQKNTANAIPQGLSSDEQGRRIPFNSVIEDRVRPWLIVRFLCCCCCLLTPGWDWKKAYWISAFNLICAIAHGTMTYLCLSAAWGKGEKFEIPIHRIRADWESGAADGYNFTVTTDEMLPIRFDWLTASFFGLSFFSHLAAFLAGWFDRYIQYYWRQLDLCFAWWRCAACHTMRFHAACSLSFSRAQVAGVHGVGQPHDDGAGHRDGHSTRRHAGGALHVHGGHHGVWPAHGALLAAGKNHRRAVRLPEVGGRPRVRAGTSALRRKRQPGHDHPVELDRTFPQLHAVKNAYQTHSNLKPPFPALAVASSFALITQRMFLLLWTGA